MRPGPLQHIADRRLLHQGITRPRHQHAADVVAWLGAVQAQEYAAARWGLALRMKAQSTEADIERAFNEGRILRTHVLRPTWHFVTPDDIRWMLMLTAPRVHRALASYTRNVGLDAAVLTRATSVCERALGHGRALTRTELGAELARHGLAVTGMPLALITMYAELEGIICSGGRRGKESTYALLAERAPDARRLPVDEALGELTVRYFRSHGPATVRDFVWWSGLKTLDAKRGLEITRARHQVIEGHTYWTLSRDRPGAARTGNTVHLLPIYDEYLVAYRERDAVPFRHSRASAGSAAPVTFQHPLIIGGQLAGTWKTVRNASGTVVHVILLRRLTGVERGALNEAATRYGRFLDVPASVAIGQHGRS